MKLYGKTDIGNKRRSNQDTFRNKVVDDCICWSLVCDGMGGVHGGDIASNVAADAIETFLDGKLECCADENKLEQIMVEALSEGNTAVFSRAVDEPELKGMGTTAVLAVFCNNKVYIAHVGDSRAYIYNGQESVQATTDHSFVQELVNRGEITREQARVHPRKNIITRSLGVHSMVNVDFGSFDFKDKNIMILCTDGLSDYLTEDVLTEFCQKSEDYELVDGLIAYALQCGGIDNITVTAVYNN